MKKLDIKSIFLLELVIALVVGLFALDFLPRNYNEFNRICLESWSKEPKQFETCMAPYYNEINLSKYLIGAGIVTFVLTPFLYPLIAKKISSD